MDEFLSNVQRAPMTPTMMIFLTLYDRVRCGGRHRRHRRRAPITRSVIRISLTCRQKSCAAGCQSQPKRKPAIVLLEGEFKAKVHISYYSSKPRGTCLLKWRSSNEDQGLFLGFPLVMRTDTDPPFSMLCHSHEEQAVQYTKTSDVTSVSYHPEI